MAYDVKWLLRLKTGLKVGFCSNFTQNEVFLFFFENGVDGSKKEFIMHLTYSETQ